MKTRRRFRRLCGAWVFLRSTPGGQNTTKFSLRVFVLLVFIKFGNCQQSSPDREYRERAVTASRVPTPRCSPTSGPPDKPRRIGSAFPPSPCPSRARRRVHTPRGESAHRLSHTQRGKCETLLRSVMPDRLNKLTAG